MTIPHRVANGVGNIPDADQVMDNYDWLTALLTGNFVTNAGLERWNDATSYTNPANGTAIADNWTWRKSGTSSPTADVSREASIIDSETYSGKINITVAGSSDSFAAFDQKVSNYFPLKGETVIFGAKVRASTASKVRLKITDGVTTQYSSYHTGGGTFELLQIALTCSASMDSLTVSVEITSDFTGAVYVDSSYIYDIPALMSAAGKAALAYSSIFTKETIVPNKDGTQSYRLFVDGGVLSYELYP